MALISGTKLGAYEIQSPLGIGGMGEVYRATDTKLGRDVALKVLPAEMARDPERLARFRREAKALAQIDHPNIVTIYSVEDFDGVQFLTMQLVEGLPLDRLISQSGLPVDQIIAIAGSLAAALVAAHEKGIVRDPVATSIVARMDELFAVDAEARRKALSTAARHIRRQETAKPLLGDIRSKIEAAQSVALPSSALSKACQYALTLWRKLTRFLEYPELELSNNLAENSMRPVALGRKNWIHIGSPQAGPKVAAILSVVESCRRLKLPVRDYLATILPGLADLPIRRLPELTPKAWVSSS
jgi:serine/threonine protein kinase